MGWLQLWGRERLPPGPSTLVIGSLLIASEGRPISPAAIDFAARIGLAPGAAVHVLSIARVWGTSFGLPNPGLLPNKHEWEEQRGQVAGAIAVLRRHGIEASGKVVGTRQAAKKIVAEAKLFQCDAIVMAADPPRHWLIGNLMWSHEPYRVRQLSPIPVYLIVEAPT